MYNPYFKGEPIDYCHGIDIAHAVGCALNKLHEPSGVSICAGKCYFVTGTPLKASDIVRLISKFRGNVPVKALPEALGTVISATTNLQRDILEFIGHETPGLVYFYFGVQDMFNASCNNMLLMLLLFSCK